MLYVSALFQVTTGKQCFKKKKPTRCCQISLVCSESIRSRITHNMLIGTFEEQPITWFFFFHKTEEAQRDEVQDTSFGSHGEVSHFLVKVSVINQ